MARTDRRLSSLERSAVAEEVAVLLRHELRNKLASVRNASFYLRRKVAKTELPATDPRIEVFFALIDDELMAAEQLLTERLSLQHLFEARIEPTTIAGAAAEAIRLAAPPASVQIATSIDDAIRIDADASELALMIRCLIDNSIDAMPEGGDIRISARPVDDAMVLEIADTGTGMGESERRRAFEPFVTTKPEHAGIGLNMARRIAERYGGRVEIESNDAGATVRIAFRGKKSTRPAAAPAR